MAVFCPLPGFTFSSDALSADQDLRFLSGMLFGLYTPYSELGDPQGGISFKVIRAGSEAPGAFCARTGDYFPGDRLVRDGQGRLVGDVHYTEGQIIPELPPWPLFGYGNVV